MESRYLLIQFRRKRGLTQTKMAKLLGISRSVYCRFENGTRNPKPYILKTYIPHPWVQLPIFFLGAL
ncbi:MAG: helix-turn-helix domain-containing protein, partial [Moorellaceae bacterium]